MDKRFKVAKNFASTRPVQIATVVRMVYILFPHFASTRPVQIATIQRVNAKDF